MRNTDHPTTPYFTDDPMTSRKVARRKEIEKASDELRDAMIAFEDLDEKDTDIKLQKAKAQLRLSQAKDVIRNLRQN